MIGDICPSCGGNLLMTAGTRLEFIAECERCLVRYAFTEFSDDLRKVERTGVYLAALGLVGILWFVGGVVMGGSW